MTSRTYSVMDAAVFSHARDRRNSGSGLPKYYAIKAVAEALDVSPRTIRRPQGVNVVGFKQPTREELDHDFLWRIYPYAPGLGRVAIFNPSHYEDVLIARVHRLVPKDVWKPRFGFINNWEKLLVSEKNTTILKFFLLISKEEQLARF